MSSSQAEGWDEKAATVYGGPSEPANNPSKDPSDSETLGMLGVVLVGHGTRRAQGVTQFQGLVESFATRFPEWRVREGYIELTTPSLDEALAEQARHVQRVVVIPVFLFLAGHVKNDMPLALAEARRRFPGVRFSLAPPLGVDSGLCDLTFRRLEAVAPVCEHSDTHALLVGRGSSDPDANGDFYKISRLVSEGRDLARVEPCYLGITEPNVPSGMALLARMRPKQIVVVPYVLFLGRLLERLEKVVTEFRESHPWIRVVMAEPLGADPVVLDLLAKRAVEALEGKVELPCDTCQYRTELPGRTREAGGLRALLWSMRHSFTHTQAMPAEHAHPSVEKHVFICANADCAKRGSTSLLRELRREVKQAGMSRKVRVTKSSCMGRCGEGPSVAVYPDGIWYREVQPQDALELVREHFQADRLVARLVDNILQ